MELSTLQSWLWRAACSIRGEVDAARYKDYILPLVFYKRLDDVYDDELQKLGKSLNTDASTTELFVETDRSLVRFFIPAEARWRNVRNQTDKLGELLTDNLRAIGQENPLLRGVIDRRDFNATDGNQRILDDNTLAQLVNILQEQRLGLDDVQPDILGRAYEYLIRKFAERGSSAGEFFTPTDVGFLLARILDPQPGDTIDDPTSGSGGLLIKTQLRHREKLAAALGKPVSELLAEDDPRPVQLFGQEIQADTVATSKMNAFVHDMRVDIRQGNTMRNPLFLNEDGSLRRFNKIAANPMWNQPIPIEVYDNDAYSRFVWGIPPAGTADWGWVQHMYASLEVGGRMAVVLDTGAASRGSGNRGRNAERDIRKQFVDADAVDAVILLPDNLFFNTSAPGIILVMQRVDATHPRAHAGEVLIINASKHFVKGRPKNEMTPEQVAKVGDLYLNWQAKEGISVVIKQNDLIRNDYNLSPSRYIGTDKADAPLPLEDALVLLAEAEDIRKSADANLNRVLASLGFANWHPSSKLQTDI
ncbi:MAG: SAM-dependent DNA methyltransferase [Caldilineaceae bacterium]|nr:SAM-dependent DNA methyltransferase [Caldilineaceae bacterium]